jgi:LacI family transcriptional regulator
LLLLSNLHGSAQQAALALRAMHGRVDGLAVMAPQIDANELATALPPALPSILINTRDETGSRPAIRLDNRSGVRAVVDHFAELGRKRLVHVAGPQGNVDADERAAAFVDACAAHRLECAVVRGDFEESSGEQAVNNLLQSGQRFDALFAANDNMAIGALQALHSAGLRTPEDVAVAGFDDVPLARHLGLTTVRVRIAELGERALARLFTAMANGDEGGEELHVPELIVRSTTDSDGRP